MFGSLLSCILSKDGAVHATLEPAEILYLTIAYDWFLFGYYLHNRLHNLYHHFKTSLWAITLSTLANINISGAFGISLCCSVCVCIFEKGLFNEIVGAVGRQHERYSTSYPFTWHIVLSFTDCCLLTIRTLTHSIAPYSNSNSDLKQALPLCISDCYIKSIKTRPDQTFTAKYRHACLSSSAHHPLSV